MAVTLEPMPATRYEWFMRHSTNEYTADLVALGRAPDEARLAAERDVSAYFPGGEPLPGHHLVEIRDGHEGAVGYLWIGPSATGVAEDWWVWDVYVDEAHRGKGYARRAMQLGEELAEAHGAITLGLSVFGFNVGAKALYDSLGYTTTSIKMVKAIGGDASG